MHGAAQSRRARDPLLHAQQVARDADDRERAPGPELKQRLLVAGLGNIGRRLLEILTERADLIRDRHGLSFEVVGVADSSGALHGPTLEVAKVIAAKKAGRRLASLPGATAGMSCEQLVSSVPADVFLEATPIDLTSGEPGLSALAEALRRKIAAVTANKGPLVLAWDRLSGASDWVNPSFPPLRFSGSVCGALPTLNVGRRDLLASRIQRMEGVLNSTTQIILSRMAEGGGFSEALAEAQQKGQAETNPSLDVDGWDAANKLVILANSVLRHPTRLADVKVRGIRDVTPAQVREAKDRGGRLSLVATAEPSPGGYAFTVEPRALPPEHALARLVGGAQGLTYETDLYGTVAVLSVNPGAGGAAAAMLRDLIEIGLAAR